MTSIDFYIMDETMPFEEDTEHEFKGHKNFAVEDLPPWTQEHGNRTRRSISRSLNAFLNNGHGGTVYLGVIDIGYVRGLPLTIFQRDHIKVNLDNLMRRYKPPVDLNRYTIRFVPVVEKGISHMEACAIRAEIDKESATCSKKDRMQSHLCQTYEHCWCDSQAIYMFKNMKQVSRNFIVEISIKAWDPNTMFWSNSIPGINLHPMHINEEGMVFIRTLAGVVPCDDQEIVNITCKDVAQVYKTKIDAIKKKINQLKS